MKQILCIAVAAMMSFTAFAQEGTIVGKWKIAKITAEGMVMNLEKPEEFKAAMAEQMKAAGQDADDAQLDMAVSMIIGQFDNVSFDYAADGSYTAVTPDESNPGSTKTIKGTYTFDKATGKLSTTSKEGSKESTKTSTIKFEGDYVIVQPSEEKVVLTLKRVK
jgi:hypothetical protein